ncbi:hypothetical protein D9M70_583160 [compost metagenome]
MVDRHPIEAGVEILLHLADEIAREALEVRHLKRIVRRDDKPEMMPVAVASLSEGLRVRRIAIRAEHTGFLPVAGHALAPQISEMSGKRCTAAAEPYHPRLDDGATRAGRDQAIGLNGGALAMPEARAIAGADRTTL